MENDQNLSNLSPNEVSQMNELQKRRMERMKSMGVPSNILERQNEIHQSQGVARVSSTAGSLEALNRVNAIKNGAMKDSMSQFVETKSPNQSFQEIPVNKPRNPQAELERQRKISESDKVGLGSINNVKGSSEARAIESMFDTDHGSSYNSDVIMGNGRNPYSESSVSNPIGVNGGEKDIIPNEYINQSIPSLEQIWERKRAQLGTNPQPNPQNSNNPSIDIETIVGIVDSVVDKKVRNILDEYSSKFESNSVSENKNTFKRVKNYDNVIKIGEKCYKLTEVKFKKKT